MLVRRYYNLIAVLAVGLFMCVCPDPVESRTRNKNVAERRLMSLYGNTSHVEALLGRSRLTPDTYKTLRNAFFRYEESRSLCYDLELTERELQANETIMAVKLHEYTEGLLTLHLFKPPQHIFDYTMSIYVETLEKLKKDNPDFIGSRMIYAPIRNTNPEGVVSSLETLKEIKAQYLAFIHGFAPEGQEELGRPLSELIDQLEEIPADRVFYFHAGETNWFGSSQVENQIDAILLGTKRIGHGFGLVKHPVVLDMLKKLNVAIEVNPISNQATPLTHDFYIAFLGIASQHSDLRLLKKLALNSIQYSSLPTEQQFEALEKWQAKWDQFIADVNEESPNRGSSSLHLD
ncbi:GL25220 [Drosophila persimilis]|uniref:GL25220 n=1 Tax=Drosophila persimilis TaxID=7234 RepID=B4GRL1_DROPE|nr:GL25220 [Drosophila persimilis]